MFSTVVVCCVHEGLVITALKKGGGLKQRVPAAKQTKTEPSESNGNSANTREANQNQVRASLHIDEIDSNRNSNFES